MSNNAQNTNIQDVYYCYNDNIFSQRVDIYYICSFTCTSEDGDMDIESTPEQE